MKRNGEMEGLREGRQINRGTEKEGGESAEERAERGGVK